MRIALRVSALILALTSTALLIAALAGLFDRGACLDAGGRYDATSGSCQVPPDATFVPVTRRPTIYASWLTTMGVSVLLLWLAGPGSRASAGPEDHRR